MTDSDLKTDMTLINVNYLTNAESGLSSGPISEVLNKFQKFLVSRVRF